MGAFEAKKHALKQVQSGEYLVTFKIQQGCIPMALLKDEMGTAYGMALAEIELGKQPKVPIFKDGYTEESHPEKTASQRAYLAVSSEPFQRWLNLEKDAPEASEDCANAVIKHYCGIESKSELDTNPEARKKFLALRSEFLSWYNLPPLSAYEN